MFAALAGVFFGVMTLLASGAWAQTTPQVAILGDSLSTGAATHPVLSFDTKEMWRVFSGEVNTAARLGDIPQAWREHLPESLPAPSRPWLTNREFFSGFDWIFRNAMHILSRRYLDTEEYSWGYLLAAALRPNDAEAQAKVIIAAENGARVEQMARHTDRVLSLTGGVLPEQIFVMYSGNDLCGPSMAYVTTPQDYRRGLERGLAYMRRNGTPPASGTDVYVLGYLGVVQLLYAQDIQNKTVQAFGEAVTCKELRRNGYRSRNPDTYDPQLPPEAFYFQFMLPPNPAAFCPTLFAQAQNEGRKDEETLGALANRIRDYRSVQRAVVDDFQKQLAADGDAGMRVHYIEETGAITFGAADIAQDCFHLSIEGQARVAQSVLSYLRDQ